MNERIKELAEQACDIMPLYDSINRGDYTHSQYNIQIELLLGKFAELIVKECAKVANDNFDKGFCPVGEFITNYFGIGK